MTIHDAGTPSLGSTEPGEAADADLVLRSRSGDRAAFGELWRRHYPAGVSVARAVTSSLDPDDLVQEAFTHIYRSILTGGGPTGSFRAYLFTSIRNTAATWGRARRETAMDALETVEDPSTTEQATSDALDRGLTHRAFRSLPTRWQEVLWYSEIEQMKPAEIAPLLGMKPTAVAQLTFRAREGLREAWIQAHLRSVADGSMCQWTIDRLGAYERLTISRRDRAKVEAHLGECARCTIVASEAREVSSRLALVLLPVTVGAGAAAGYLASLQGAGVPAMALAAMPSSVMQGAVTILPGAAHVAAASGGAGSLGAGTAGAAGVAGAGSAGVAGSTAAGAAAAGASTAAAGGGLAVTAASAAGVAGAGAAGAAAVTAVTAAAGGIFSSVGVFAGLATAGLVVVSGVVAGAVGLPPIGASPTANQVSTSISADQTGVSAESGGGSVAADASAGAAPEADSVTEGSASTPLTDADTATAQSESGPARTTPSPSASAPGQVKTTTPPGQAKTTPPGQAKTTPPGQAKTDTPSSPQEAGDAPGESGKDPKSVTSAPVLPAGSLAIAASTSYPTPDADGTTLALTVTGVPGAVVELRIRGGVLSSATIGDDGTAVLLAQPTAQDLKSDARVDVRYVDAKSTGPSPSAKLGALL